MTFDNKKIARELPKTVLLDLLRRTCAAHKNLNEVWIKAVGDECGEPVAESLRAKLWPEQKDWKLLFIDDLRFVIAASQLKPDLLTFSFENNASLPRELTNLGFAFKVIIALSSLSNKKPNNQKGKPAWTDSPNRLLYWLRGKGIDTGFIALASLWKKTEFKTSAAINIEAYEQSLEHLSNQSLELLYNYYAIAYMFVTNRWYQAVEAQFNAALAQKLEMLVWVDLEAAEYDLDIAIQGIQEQGKTVESLLKGFQFAPGEVGILDVDFELKNENHGILTHKTCPAVDRFEHYDDKRLKHCCDICIYAMPISGEMLDQDIACKALELPPRKDANDIACQWEYILKTN